MDPPVIEYTRSTLPIKYWYLNIGVTTVLKLASDMSLFPVAN